MLILLPLAAAPSGLARADEPSSPPPTEVTPALPGIASAALPEVEFTQEVPAGAPPANTAPADGEGEGQTHGYHPGASRWFGDSALRVRLYADAHYAQDFNNPYNGIRRFNSSPFYVNQFDVGYAFVETSLLEGPFRLTLAVHHGSVVEKMYEGEGNELWKQFREVSGEVNFGHGLSLEAGIMPAHYGYEGFPNLENWFATRAVMTDFAPDFDLGARLTWRPDDRWLFRVQVANGWQTLRDTNRAKSFGTLVRYEHDGLLVNWGTMLTREPYKKRYLEAVAAPEAETGSEEFHYSDLPDYERYYSNFFIHKKWERFWLAGLFDFGVGEHGENSLGSVDAGNYDFWTSAGVLAKYFFAQNWAVGSRTEYFHDPHTIVPEVMTYTPHGFQTVGQTLGLEWSPRHDFAIRLEGKYYHSRDPVYTDSTEIDPASLADLSKLRRDDVTALLSVAYNFTQTYGVRAKAPAHNRAQPRRTRTLGPAALPNARSRTRRMVA